MKNYEWLQSLNKDGLTEFLSEGNFCEIVCEDTPCSFEYTENLHDTCHNRVKEWLEKEHECVR